jgi:hypothetical protein
VVEVGAEFHDACVGAVYAAERHDIASAIDRMQRARDLAEQMVIECRKRGELYSAQEIIDRVNEVFAQCKQILSEGGRPVLDQTKVDGRTRGLMATQAAPNLWQAKAPRTVKGKAELKSFRTVVSCVPLYGRVPKYTHAPVKVTGKPLTDRERKSVHDAADVAHASVVAGKPTIVLCADGKIASGLIVALVLKKLSKQPWLDVVRMMQAVREGALGNLHFVQVLMEEQG